MVGADRYGAASPLFEGVGGQGDKIPVWMSHGDRVAALPEGFAPIATTRNAPFAAIADEKRRLYGVQFHPEVVHTPGGAAMLRNFVHKIAGCGGDWTMAAFREAEIKRIREQVGDAKVICGLSGGVGFGCCGGVAARGDWRAAHLHLRGPRAFVPGRPVKWAERRELRQKAA